MKKYISVDIEASGINRDRYSILSIGACVVGEQKFFYRELKPKNDNYDPEAMKIACLGLKCLEDDERYDPRSKAFRPDLALKVLQGQGIKRGKAMNSFRHWVKHFSRGFEPIFTSAPIDFDYDFIDLYFKECNYENPFQGKQDSVKLFWDADIEKEEDIDELMELIENENPHNALEDAKMHARLVGRILQLTGTKYL